MNKEFEWYMKTLVVLKSCPGSREVGTALERPVN